MRFGVCGTYKKMLAGLESGYDYVEIPISKLRAEGEETIDAIEKALREHAFSADAFNGFFPADIPLYDGGEAAVRYAAENIRIAERLGTKLMVIGSGGARRVPEALSKDDALSAFREVVFRIAEKALPAGIRIAVEPLNYHETNLINTLSDCIDFSRSVGMENVGAMVDFYHFALNGESFGVFKELKPGELIHVHVARPDESRAALTLEDAPAIDQWKQVLKDVGYDGTVTLECRHGAGLYQEYQEALPAMKRLQA